jgi:hypothetical protein
VPGAPGAAAGTCPTAANGTLAGFASCTVNVRFTPAAGGARSAILRFTDNSNNVAGSTQDVALSGTGVAPQPVATTAPAAGLTFAARPINTTSAAQNVTLSNTGQTALTIASITFAGTNPGDFARSGGSCPTAANGTLAAGASCTVGVTFRPGATGARSAVLRFTDNSGNVAGSQQNVPLSGTGQAAAPLIGVTPSPVAFGNNSLLLGGAGVSRTITVTNTGSANMVFGAGAVTILGGNANNFTFTGTNNCSGSTRAPNATCTITVRFRTNGLGARTTTLRIASNVAGSPTIVTMTGNGTL